MSDQPQNLLRNFLQRARPCIYIVPNLVLAMPILSSSSALIFDCLYNHWTCECRQIPQGISDTARQDECKTNALLKKPSTLAGNKMCWNTASKEPMRSASVRQFSLSRDEIRAPSKTSKLQKMPGGNPNICPAPPCFVPITWKHATRPDSRAGNLAVGRRPPRVSSTVAED